MIVGLFVHFDFSMKGMLHAEIRNYNRLFNRPDIEFVVIFDYDEATNKMLPHFTFPYTVVKISGFRDVEKFNQIDAMFTWQWHQSFKEKAISRKHIEVFKIMSVFTTVFKKSIYFRLCDTRHFQKDYKEMIESKREKDEFFNEINGSNIFALDYYPNIDYNKCFYLANGKRDMCDWTHKTLAESMPFLDSELVKKHTIYLSDEMFFMYHEDYEKFKYLEKREKVQKLYHVGNLNPEKAQRFAEIFVEGDVPTVLRLSKKGINEFLYDMINVEIREPGLYGDAIYEEISKHIAYLFIGNGNQESSYLNKTLYDASIARTVFLIYKEIDKGGIYKNMSDYYFETPADISRILSMINVNYELHLSIQRKFLLENQSDEKLTIV